jgi:GWxTD domain-containing protein
MRIRNLLLFTLSVFFVLTTCTSSRKAMQIKSSNQYYLYNPGSTFMHPEFSFYHQSDTSTQLYIKFFTDEFLFNQANPEQTMQAGLNIKYQLFDITDDKINPVLVDSSTFIRYVEKRNIRKVLLIPLFIKALAGREYTIRVVSLDINRKASHTASLYVDKLTAGNYQNYKLLQTQGGAPLFRSYITSDDLFKIVSHRNRIETLFIRYQKNNLPLPAPAFSMTGEKVFEFRTDSSWVFPYNLGQNYNFQTEGLYFIQPDSSKDEGLYLMHFGKHFPKIKTPESMIEPLEYITTTTEFRKLKAESNKKLAVDNYWLKLGGNPDVSRELIRVFYTRTYFANYYFTSFKEGWKTDRGMIYIIFGQPNYITKTASSEVWEYYNTQSAKSVEFVFDKVPSLYTGNHYLLQRSEYFNSFWRQAVDTWRSGKVYSAEE